MILLGVVVSASNIPYGFNTLIQRVRPLCALSRSARNGLICELMLSRGARAENG